MQLRKDRISELLAKSAGKLRATIYLPTHPSSSPESLTQDRTTFKNAIQALRRHDAYDSHELDEVTSQLEAEIYENLEFWKHLDYGLAFMISSTGYQYFHLPFQISEQLFVSDEFVVSPLILMAGADMNYYLLDVNFTQPKLWYGSRGSFKEVALSEMPGSFDDELGRDEYKNQLQHKHGGNIGFHGHTDESAISDDQQRYLSRIAEAVDSQLSKQSASQPLILSGTDNRVGNLRKHLKYQPTLSSHLVGNFENASANEVFDKSYPLAKDYLLDQINQSVERLLSAAPEYVAIGDQEIIDVAREGRVDTLYVPTYRFADISSSKSVEPTLVMDLPASIYDIEPMVTEVHRQGGRILPVELDAFEGLDQPKALCRF